MTHAQDYRNALARRGWIKELIDKLNLRGVEAILAASQTVIDLARRQYPPWRQSYEINRRANSPTF